MSSGEISVEEQLTEMAFTGGHFDIREVLAQMVTAGIMYEVGPALQSAALKGATGPGRTLTEGEKLVLQAQLNFANTVASGISSAIFEGQKLDAQFFESMAAQFLGSEIGQEIVTQTSVDHKIGDAIKAQVQAHPTIASIINDIGAAIGELEKDLDDIGNAMDKFIKSEIISPQAQTPAPVVAPKKPSQAKAMSRLGLHARRPQVQNYADASGNYIGAGLGLGAEPDDIKDFDPYSDSGSNPNVSDGVSKMPTVRNNSKQLNTPNVMQGSSKTTFFQNALHELVNEIQEVATYIKPAGESFKASGEGYMGVGNNYSNLGSQLLKGFPNSESFATEGQSASEVEFEEMAQQISRVGAGYVALGLKMDGNGRALIAVGFGLQIKVAYDNVQAAPGDLRTAMEVKEYGGIGAGVVGALIGAAAGTIVARSPVVGGLVGDLVGMSLWKGAVDDFEPQLVQHNVRNGY